MMNKEVSLQIFIVLELLLICLFLIANQGNIKAAKAVEKYNTATQKNTEATIEENISRSLQKVYAEDKLYKNIDPDFFGDFDRLAHEVLINYEKRNIGLLDFLDFYDSYKENILQINQPQI